MYRQPLRKPIPSPLMPKQNSGSLFEMAAGFDQLMRLTRQFEKLHADFSTKLEDTHDMSKEELRKLALDFKKEALQQLSEHAEAIHDAHAVRLEGAINAIHQKIAQADEKIKEVKHGKDGRDGMPGEKGDAGDRGPIPVAGIDFTLPKDGKDGEHADPEKVIEAIKKLPQGKKLTVEHIEGLKVHLDSLSRQIGGAQGGWKMRGGGDTVKAGSNITLTRNADGTVTISGSASSSSSTIEKLDGTQSGGNVTLTFSGLAHNPVTIIGIYRNGQLLSPASYTLTGTTSASILNAATSDDYLIYYAY